MAAADLRIAKVEHAVERLRDGVQDGVLQLRGIADEVEAHGGLEAEAIRLRTIACILESAEDVPDAIRFTAPAIAAIGERLHEAEISVEGYDLRMLARVLIGRVVAADQARTGGPW